MTYFSKESMIQMSAIDAFGAYNKPAVNAINDPQNNA
jgi:hypothetical protein